MIPPIVDSFRACPPITVSLSESLTTGVLHSACQTRPALPKLIPETGSLMELEQFSGWKVGRWRMVSSLRNKYSGLATSAHRPVVVVVEEVVVEVIIVVEVIVVVKVVVEVIFVVVFVVVEVEVGAEIAVVEVVVVVIIVGLEVVVVVLGLLVVVGVVFRGTSGRRRKRRRVVRLMRMMRTELRTEQTF